MEGSFRKFVGDYLGQYKSRISWNASLDDQIEQSLELLSEDKQVHVLWENFEVHFAQKNPNNPKLFESELNALKREWEEQTKPVDFPEPEKNVKVVPNINIEGLLYKFGHDQQCLDLKKILENKNPAVVIVHGVEGCAHRHLIDRTIYELELENKIILKPMPAMQWFDKSYQPATSRLELAGAMARALALNEMGTMEEIEIRIATELAKRARKCIEENKMLVFDVLKPLKPTLQKQAESLVILVQELWESIMTRVKDDYSKRPVFLVLAIEYPLNQSGGPTSWWRKRIFGSSSAIDWITSAFEVLNRKPDLSDGTLVKVLQELATFTEDEIADFLRNTTLNSTMQAKNIAKQQIWTPHNEKTIENLRDFLLNHPR